MFRSMAQSCIGESTEYGESTNTCQLEIQTESMECMEALPS